MPAGLRRRAKFHCLGFRYVGQNRKNMEFCGKNLPLRVGGQSHYAIFTKFDRTFMQTSLKCGLIAPKSPKLIILGINLPPQRVLSDFYKIWHGRGSPRSAPSPKIS